MFLFLRLSVFLSRPFHFPRLHWQCPILLHVQEERLQASVWTCSRSGHGTLAQAAASRLPLWG